MFIPSMIESLAVSLGSSTIVLSLHLEQFLNICEYFSVQCFFVFTFKVTVSHFFPTCVVLQLLVFTGIISVFFYSSAGYTLSVLRFSLDLHPHWTTQSSRMNLASRHSVLVTCTTHSFLLETLRSRRGT